jgi:nucleotide-binding universal stress UspA family protein
MDQPFALDIEQDIQRVVVGVDLGATGAHALYEAMRLARRSLGCELHVAHVISVPRGLHDAQRIDALESLLRERLELLHTHVSEVCRPQPGGEAFTHEMVFHVRLGEPAAALHQVAVDIDADLMVVGTHGRKGMDKLLLGSVAETLVREAHVPVLVARPKSLGDLPKSDRAEAARPEVLLGDGASLTHRLHLEFQPQTAHISGPR